MIGARSSVLSEPTDVTLMVGGRTEGCASLAYVVGASAVAWSMGAEQPGSRLFGRAGLPGEPVSVMVLDPIHDYPPAVR